MPVYHNATSVPLSFEIAGHRFDVPPGAECEIDRTYAYVVKHRGLPLTKGRSPVAGALEVEPTREVVRTPPLPPGVETGPAREAADPDDAEDDQAGDGDAGSGPVADVAARLTAQGVTLPGTARATRTDR